MTEDRLIMIYDERMLSTQIFGNRDRATEAKAEWLRRYGMEYPYQKLANGDVVKYGDWGRTYNE